MLLLRLLAIPRSPLFHQANDRRARATPVIDHLVRDPAEQENPGRINTVDEEKRQYARPMEWARSVAIWNDVLHCGTKKLVCEVVGCVATNLRADHPEACSTGVNALRSLATHAVRSSVAGALGRQIPCADSD